VGEVLAGDAHHRVTVLPVRRRGTYGQRSTAPATSATPIITRPRVNSTSPIRFVSAGGHVEFSGARGVRERGSEAATSVGQPSSGRIRPFKVASLPPITEGVPVTGVARSGRGNDRACLGPPVGAPPAGGPHAGGCGPGGRTGGVAPSRSFRGLQLAHVGRPQTAAGSRSGRAPPAGRGRAAGEHRGAAGTVGRRSGMPRNPSCSHEAVRGTIVHRHCGWLSTVSRTSWTVPCIAQHTGQVRWPGCACHTHWRTTRAWLISSGWRTGWRGAPRCG
jgi:hypothetical protein